MFCILQVHEVWCYVTWKKVAYPRIAWPHIILISTTYSTHTDPQTLTLEYLPSNADLLTLIVSPTDDHICLDAYQLPLVSRDCLECLRQQLPSVRRCLYCAAA